MEAPDADASKFDGAPAPIVQKTAPIRRKRKRSVGGKRGKGGKASVSASSAGSEGPCEKRAKTASEHDRERLKAILYANPKLISIKPAKDIERKIDAMSIQEVRGRLRAIRSRPGSRVEGTIAAGLIQGLVTIGKMIPVTDDAYLEAEMKTDAALQESYEDVVGDQVMPFVPFHAKAALLTFTHLVIATARGLPKWLNQKKQKEEITIKKENDNNEQET